MTRREALSTAIMMEALLGDHVMAHMSSADACKHHDNKLTHTLLLMSGLCMHCNELCFILCQACNSFLGYGMGLGGNSR